MSCAYCAAADAFMDSSYMLNKTCENKLVQKFVEYQTPNVTPPESCTFDNIKSQLSILHFEGRDKKRGDRSVPSGDELTKFIQLRNEVTVGRGNKPKYIKVPSKKLDKIVRAIQDISKPLNGRFYKNEPVLPVLLSASTNAVDR